MPAKGTESSGQILERILQITEEGFWFIDLGTITLDINPAMCAILDRLREDVIGRSIFEFVDEANREIFDREITARAQGDRSSYEVSLRRRDGTNVPCINTATPVLDDQGQRIGSIGLWKDISKIKQTETALIESEERFRDFSNSASDWLWEMDENLRFSFVSDLAQKLSGVPLDQMIGQTREELITKSSDKEKWRGHIADLKAHRPFRDFRYIFEHADGTDRYWSISGKPVFSTQGNFRGYRGTGTDITQRRHDEEQLRLALADAEQANQAKTDFLATMSHELRTPLNAIIGFSDMIERQYFGALGSDKYREYAHDIHVSSEHLLSLINDILDLSAIEAGKQTLVREDLVVMDIAADCAQIVLVATKEKNIEVSFQARDELATLSADRRAVKQILFNLLSNAVKYTPENGRIAIKATAADGFHTLEVRDTGIGIAAEKIPAITDPFVRTVSDPHITQEGTGLGLAIVKSLVDLHGGELNIESEVGGGTSVTVKLPS